MGKLVRSGVGFSKESGFLRVGQHLFPDPTVPRNQKVTGNDTIRCDGSSKYVPVNTMVTPSCLVW